MPYGRDLPYEILRERNESVKFYLERAHCAYVAAKSIEYLAEKAKRKLFGYELGRYLHFYNEGDRLLSFATTLRRQHA